MPHLTPRASLWLWHGNDLELSHQKPLLYHDFAALILAYHSSVHDCTENGIRCNREQDLAYLDMYAMKSVLTWCFPIRVVPQKRIQLKELKGK
jgi:hypothetical protein